MALYLILLTAILAFSLVSTEQNVSSPGSSIDLSPHSMKYASGNWNITVDKRQYTKKNTQPLSENVHQEPTNNTEQLARPSLHDTSMIAAVQPTAASTSTPTTTTTPKSCPQSGYQLYPGFNCYKAFPSRDERKTWSEAREQCMRDGGDLIVMDTEREREDVYIPLRKSVYFYDPPWVGVYIPQAGNDWMSVKGEPWWAPGNPVKNAAGTTGLLGNWDCAGEPARSTWWAPGNPVKNAAGTTGLLGNWDCADARSHCEPLLVLMYLVHIIKTLYK